jgi:hypothetical protein
MCSSANSALVDDVMQFTEVALRALPASCHLRVRESALCCQVVEELVGLFERVFCWCCQLGHYCTDGA